MASKLCKRGDLIDIVAPAALGVVLGLIFATVAILVAEIADLERHVCRLDRTACSYFFMKVS